MKNLLGRVRTFVRLGLVAVLLSGPGSGLGPLAQDVARAGGASGRP
jgi:hypothetical protein